jgi:C1A family cysteine protease
MNERLGCYKSPLDERDYLATTFVADVIKDLPSKVDYTDEMSPIRNQGKEGSCVGHAGVAVKEWMEQIDYGLYIDLSERFLYEESKKISGHTKGTTLKACAKVLVEKGTCEEKYWKYVAQVPGKPEIGAYDNANRYKVEPGYIRITNEKELKASLVKYGPVLIGVLVYRNWYKQKKGHIPNLSFWENWLGQPLGGHAIALVGYDDVTKEYKFKNSWGESWGDNGYGYITYKHMKAILMDAVCMVDISDPNDFKCISIKRVGDLTSRERKTAWI